MTAPRATVALRRPAGVTVLGMALGFAGLVGCGGPAQPTSTGGAGPTGDIVLKGDGLDVAGTGLEIGFGRARPGATAAVARLLGAEPSGMRICSGLQQASWAAGLALYFRNDDFVGWSSTSGSLSTANGLSAGDTRETVEGREGARVDGFLLRSGAISGRIGKDGRVEFLQSGETCSDG